MQVTSSLDCDVVIVNYNAGDLLTDCVFSVFSAGARRAIVIDNASKDNSINHLRQRLGNDSRLSVLKNDKNLGFSTACNIGARAAFSSRLLFLNPDSVLDSGALNRMIDVLDISENTGMVGGLLCNPDGSEQPGGRRFFPSPKRVFMRAFGLSRLTKYFPNIFLDYLMYNDPLPVEPIEVEAISGACMLVKRTAMESVGLWDEAYFLHCEDLDWCMRFQQKGWKIMFVPDAKVTHFWGVCGQHRPFFVEWHKHKGMVAFYNKFYRHQYPGILMQLVALAVWFRFGCVAIYYTARHFGHWLGSKAWLNSANSR